MNTASTRMTLPDICRALADHRGRPLGRAVAERLLRDYARELPEPELVGGTRTWLVEAVEVFRVVLARDREGRPWA